MNIARLIKQLDEVEYRLLTKEADDLPFLHLAYLLGDERSGLSWVSCYAAQKYLVEMDLEDLIIERILKGPILGKEQTE